MASTPYQEPTTENMVCEIINEIILTETFQQLFYNSVMLFEFIKSLKPLSLATIFT